MLCNVFKSSGATHLKLTKCYNPLISANMILLICQHIKLFPLDVQLAIGQKMSLNHMKSPYRKSTWYKRKPPLASVRNLAPRRTKRIKMVTRFNRLLHIQPFTHSSRSTLGYLYQDISDGKKFMGELTK